MMEDEKIYFKPGDVVQIKHDIPNKPKMWVVDKSTITFRAPYLKEKESSFRGIVCRWFDINECLQESVFNTKDLIRI